MAQKQMMVPQDNEVRNERMTELQVEILMADERLEEITINGGDIPIWVYQKDYGWLKTNIVLDSDSSIFKLFSRAMIPPTFIQL